MLSQPQTQSLISTHKAVLQGGGSVSKHIQSNFTSDATLLYVPTGVLASTPTHVESLMQEYSRQAHTIQSELILSSSQTDCMIFEESLMTLVHSDQINWLLPGVRATNKEIKVVLVTVLTLDAESKITSKRVYWDQASVLRQVGVLPRSLYCKANSSEVTLPIQGAEVAAKVVSCFTESPISSEVRETVQTQQKSNDIFSNEAPAFRPSSRVLAQPGGSSSDIFSTQPLPAKEPFRRDPNQSSVDETKKPYHSGRRMLAQSNQTSFSFGSEEEIKPAENNRGMNRRDPNAQSQEQVHRPSSRVLAAPGGKSSFSFA